MSALIGALRVSLSAETAQFEAGMKRAQRQTATTAVAIEKSLGSIKGAMAGFASALSVGLLASGIKRALEYAGSLGEVSNQLGVTTKDLQTFRFAAGQLGVSQEELDKGLLKLTVTLGQVAAGAKAPTEALKAIGVSADELKGKSTGEAFRIIADGLTKVEDRSQRAAVEVALFGRTGAKLDNLLAGGRSSIDELANAAEKLGIVLSDRQIQQADETADKLEAVKTVLAANIAGTVANNAGAILNLASALGTLTGQILKFLNSNPTLALGILGAMLGGRLGGLPGAAAGAFAGAVAGSKMASGAQQPENVALLRHNLIQARNAGLAKRKAGKPLTVGEVARLNRLTDKLNAATGHGPSLVPEAVGGSDVGNFLASPGGSKREKKDHSEQDALNALRDAYQFKQDMARGQADILQAQRDLAHTADERAALDLQLLDADKQAFQDDLAYQVAQNKITKGKEGISQSQADQLQANYDIADALKRQAIAEDLAAQHAQDAAQLTDTQYDIQRNLLEKEANLAETASARRAVELRLLDLVYAQEKARLEAVLADKQSSELAKKEAQARLDALSAGYALDKQQAMQSTRGPAEQFMADLPTTAAKWEEALQGVAVRGFGSLEDGILDVITGVKSLGDAFREVANQIISDLLRIAIQRAIIAPLANALFGGAGGALAGGFNTGGFTFGMGSGGLPGIPGFATGGGGVLGGRGGIDRNVLSLNGLPIARVSRGEHLAISPTGGMGGGIYAPITIQGNATRETAGQIAAAMRRTISDFSKKGY